MIDLPFVPDVFIFIADANVHHVQGLCFNKPVLIQCIETSSEW